MSARGFSFVKPKIKVGSLKDRRDDFEKLVKGSDRGMATGQASSGVVLSPEAKAEIKKGVATTLKKTSKLRDEIDEIKGTKKEYKAKGGRVGLKFGTSRKSNLQKIQEVKVAEQQVEVDPRSKTTADGAFNYISNGGPEEVVQGQGKVLPEKNRKSKAY